MGRHVATPVFQAIAGQGTGQVEGQLLYPVLVAEGLQGRLIDATGAGATYYWQGKTEVGSGRATLISVAGNKVQVEVEVERPSPSSSDYLFTVEPEGKGALVTWSISGEKDAAGKAFGFFAVPAEEIESDMDKSLARLKTLVETEAKVAAN